MTGDDKKALLAILQENHSWISYLAEHTVVLSLLATPKSQRADTDPSANVTT